jgi:hypothetical protein
VTPGLQRPPAPGQGEGLHSGRSSAAGTTDSAQAASGDSESQTLGLRSWPGDRGPTGRSGSPGG